MWCGPPYTAGVTEPAGGLLVRAAQVVIPGIGLLLKKTLLAVAGIIVAATIGLWIWSGLNVRGGLQVADRQETVPPGAGIRADGQGANEPGLSVPGGRGPDRESAAARDVLPVTHELTVDLRWLGSAEPAALIWARLVGLVEGVDPRRARSDARGGLRFTELPAGAYRLNIGSDRLDVVLGERPSEHRVWDLVPLTDFRGQVFTPDGLPISDAVVLAYGGGEVVARSDGAGLFRVRSLNPVSRIGARAQGFGPSPVVRVPSGPENRVRLILTGPGAALEGLATAPDGSTAEGITIILNAQNSRPASIEEDGTAVEQSDRMELMTDSEGRFFGFGLRPGMTDVRVPAVEGRSVEWNGRVEALAGASEFLHIRLRGAVSVAGVVSNVAGQAVPWARVSATWGESAHQRLVTVTNDDGSFRIADLPPGPIDMLAVEPAHGTFAEAIHLRENEESRWMATLAQRGAPGRLRYHDGRPATGVHLLVTSAQFKDRVATDDDGGFQIANCPPSIESMVAYQVHDGGRQVVLGRWSNLDVQGEGLDLWLEEAAGVPCTLAVRVLDPTGAAVGDVRLLIGEPGAPASIVTGAPKEDGTFKVGPVFGPPLQVVLKSPRFGKVSLGVASPNQLGLIDLGTIHLEWPGRLLVSFEPENRSDEVERIRMFAPDGVLLHDAGHLPDDGLVMAPGAHELRVEGRKIKSESVALTVESGEDLRVRVALTAAQD